MNQGKYIFSQLIDFLPKRVFDFIVQKYKGNQKVLTFTCWNQLLCMIFGQLISSDSLRELIYSLQAHKNKYYHLGFGNDVARRTLGEANEKRSCRIFEEFASVMIDKARKSCYRSDFEVNHSGHIYAVDSTIVDLCLNVFWWAKFRKHKGAIKIHILYDLVTQIPCFLLITSASVHDVNFFDTINFEPNSFYIFDKAYIDFGRFYKIHQRGSYFVTRAKTNLKFNRIYSNKADKNLGICSDQIGRLSLYNSNRGYPEKIRRIVYMDKELHRKFVFLTNNFELPASDIALLYKNRWQIELFFKWMKQHLKIKHFWGTTINAVKIQIYCAVITYCLVAIVGSTLKIERSIYEILQILRFSLLDKSPLQEILMKNDCKTENNCLYKQLELNLL